MKRLLFLLGMLLLCSNLMLMAQRQVKGSVTDKKGHPMVGASVTVKGTSISVVTDLDGCFVIDNLPEDAAKLVVTQIGMSKAVWTIETDKEMKIVLRPGEKKIAPFVQGGVNFSRLKTDQNDDFTMGVGYTVGAGCTFACSDLFSVSSSVNLMQLKYKQEPGNDAGSSRYTAEFNPLYVEIPVLLDIKLWLGNSRKIVASVGPYVAFGVGGKCKIEDESLKLFGGDDALFKKTDAGARCEIQYQTEHFSAGMNWQVGLISPVKEDSFYDDALTVNIGFTVGYRF